MPLQEEIRLVVGLVLCRCSTDGYGWPCSGPSGSRLGRPQPRRPLSWRGLISPERPAGTPAATNPAIHRSSRDRALGRFCLCCPGGRFPQHRSRHHCCGPAPAGGLHGPEPVPHYTCETDPSPENRMRMEVCPIHQVRKTTAQTLVSRPSASLQPRKSAADGGLSSLALFDRMHQVLTESDPEHR